LISLILLIGKKQVVRGKGANKERKCFIREDKMYNGDGKGKEMT
jgi:hypothetical protein